MCDWLLRQVVDLDYILADNLALQSFLLNRWLFLEFKIALLFWSFKLIWAEYKSSTMFLCATKHWCFYLFETIVVFIIAKAIILWVIGRFKSEIFTVFCSHNFLLRFQRRLLSIVGTDIIVIDWGSLLLLGWLFQILAVSISLLSKLTLVQF